MQTLIELIRNENYPEARRRLHDMARAANSYSEAAALLRLRNKLASQHPDFKAATHVKVALLGTGTTDMIEPLLALALETWGLSCEIRRASYNTYA
jgi:hypothetical protein